LFFYPEEGTLKLCQNRTRAEPSDMTERAMTGGWSKLYTK